MKKIKDLFNSLVHCGKKSQPVLIETPRLILREIKKSDFDQFHKIIISPDFFYYCFDGTPDSVHKFIERAITTREQPKKDGKREEYHLAIVDKTNNNVIGYVSLAPEHLVKGFTHSTNFFVDPKAQNKAYGREAAINMMLYGVNELGMPGYSVTIHPDNKPSLRVAASQGYEEVGTTTLETTRGEEPRLILILKKEQFHAQIEKDARFILQKKTSNDNRRGGFFKKRKP